MVEPLLVQEYAKTGKTISRKGAKLATKKEIKSRTGTPLDYFWYGSPGKEIDLRRISWQN
jgi:hypothetical protein